MSEVIWDTTIGDGPVIATAIHDGHGLRPAAAKLVALSDADRLREEDPYTGAWTEIAGTRIIGLRSRFEVDLNRPRNAAVYRRPEDAWGLDVWKEEPGPAFVDESLAEYDAFYAEASRIFAAAEKRHGQFVVFDLHTYNHRRDGPDAEPADPAANPEVNIGTASMDRNRWAGIVDRVLRELSAFDFDGRSLDVRENVKFKGGQFSKWIHHRFPKTGCALAIEFKKFFMDEWTGKLDTGRHALILEALRAAAAGVVEELAAVSEA